MDNSDNESGVEIERATGTGNFAQIATVSADITTYADSSAIAGNTYTYRVRAYNATGHSSYSNIANVSFPLSGNTAPMISLMANRTINEDTSTGVIHFVVSDAQTSAASLLLASGSSNPGLVPDGNITFGGIEGARTVTVVPAAHQSGTATIAVMVSDGALTATTTVVVTVKAVNDAPTISSVRDVAVPSPRPTPLLAFTVGDVDNPPGSLTVTASSSNTTLVPNANIVLGGSGANRTVRVTPIGGPSRSASIALTVRDGAASTTKVFTVTVGAANSLPAISSISNQSSRIGGRIGPIPFSISANEASAASLVVTASSSNQSLVPNANLVIGGSGASRTITVSGAGGKSGTTTITVTVSDGTNTRTETFLAAFGATLPAESRVINFSTRLLCRPNLDTLIPGFTILGSVNKRVLLRVVGPTLGANPFNVTGVLQNPRMTLKRWDGTAFVDHAANDDWGASTNVSDIRAVSQQVSAFALTEGSRDAVLLLDLPPGRYTIIADDATSATGMVIAEMYDADPAGTGSKLVNMSNRGYVGVGAQVAVSGFIISPGAEKRLLIRAVGPGLAVAPHHVPNTLSDPAFDVYRRNADGTDTLVLSNDNWGDSPDATQTVLLATQVSAFPLPVGSKDAAATLTLQPGLYSVVVRGSNDTMGTALVEIYTVE